MTWRVARSLLALRSQVNELAPDRHKGEDGTIGNAEHASRSSDHNPWVMDGSIGVVTAMDITRDVAHGVDTYAMAEHLRRAEDHRIKYVISNKRIFSNDLDSWQWRPYHGSNPHDLHLHVSVKPDKASYDDETPWDVVLFLGDPEGEVPKPVLRQGSFGDSVKVLQELLDIDADGRFGAQTRKAVIDFQTAHSLVADGIVGAYTWRELLK